MLDGNFFFHWNLKWFNNRVLRTPLLRELQHCVKYSWIREIKFVLRGQNTAKCGDILCILEYGSLQIGTYFVLIWIKSRMQINSIYMWSNIVPYSKYLVKNILLDLLNTRRYSWIQYNSYNMKTWLDVGFTARRKKNQTNKQTNKKQKQKAANFTFG